MHVIQDVAVSRHGKAFPETSRICFWVSIYWTALSVSGKKGLVSGKKKKFIFLAAVLYKVGLSHL